VGQAVAAWSRLFNIRHGERTGWPELLAALASGVNGWNAPADLVTQPACQLAQPRAMTTRGNAGPLSGVAATRAGHRNS
jgi:hypothetical protein